MSIDDSLKRRFYMEMCQIEHWDTRTLDKKIDSQLYERSAISRRPAETIEKELQQVSEQQMLVPDMVFRSSYFLDMLGLPDFYSEKDLETYARCMFNRADAGSGRLTEVIAQEGQFVGYSDANTVLDDDYNLALKLIRAWHEEQTKPCDLSYQFAELTPQGIFLKNDFNADGYARRWRAA
jgi:predicted nuclease of restriction endonuclease-like (RecB) superfamily